jgi:hypothetical protein
MKVGDKVMLKSSSMYYNQAPGVVGEFMEEHPRRSDWALIRWNQERTPGRPDQDNYPMDDLILATKLAKLLAGADSEV